MKLEKLEISTDKSRLDIEMIHHFISNESYWGQGRSLEQVETTINESLCFGAYIGNKQAGFGRVLTDKVCFAYIFDVFVLPQHRGQGIGKRLIETILNHYELTTVSWMLSTNEAHELYERYGFKSIENSKRLMKRDAVNNPSSPIGSAGS